MPHSLTRDLIRRLVLVRYLYELGVDQSHKPEPIAAVALLTFHDACEMFLQIVAEHKGVTLPKNPDFSEYLAKLQVTLKVPMRRLNKARVNLKHNGVLPAHVEIEGFRDTVTSFLEDNARPFLGVNLNEVSLASTIKSDDVRGQLERAETALSTGELQVAMGEVASAFAVSLRQFERRPRAHTHPVGRPYSLRDATASHFGVFEIDELRDIERRLDRVVDVFSDAITVVAYNLDFDSYLMFKEHAPVVQFTGKGLLVEWTRPEPTDPKVVRRCLNFVIDTAIRLEALA